MNLAELEKIKKYINIEDLTIKEACEKYGVNLEGLLYEINEIEGGKNDL